MKSLLHLKDNCWFLVFKWYLTSDFQKHSVKITLSHFGWLKERKQKSFEGKHSDKTIVVNYGAELKIKPIYTSFGVTWFYYL